MVILPKMHLASLRCRSKWCIKKPQDPIKEPTATSFLGGWFYYLQTLMYQIMKSHILILHYWPHWPSIDQLQRTLHGPMKKLLCAKAIGCNWDNRYSRAQNLETITKFTYNKGVSVCEQVYVFLPSLAPSSPTTPLNSHVCLVPGKTRHMPRLRVAITIWIIIPYVC